LSDPAFTGRKRGREEGREGGRSCLLERSSRLQHRLKLAGVRQGFGVIPTADRLATDEHLRRGGREGGREDEVDTLFMLFMRLRSNAGDDGGREGGKKAGREGGREGGRLTLGTVLLPVVAARAAWIAGPSSLWSSSMTSNLAPSAMRVALAFLQKGQVDLLE